MRLDKWRIYDHPRVNWQPHKGQLVVAENNCRHKVVSAGRRWGKALDINTPILTVNGWRTMESIKVGDYVYSWNGQPVEVIAVSEIINERPCYQIDFNGAESIVCDEQHLWYSENKSHRRALSDNKRRKHSFVECIRTTKEMLEQGLRKGKDYNFTIPHTKTLDFQQDLKLSVSPYTLGVWLGDGTSSAAQVTLNEFDSKDIVDRIESEGFTVTKQSSELSWGILGLRVLLRDELKVLDNKHVPKEYLFSSYRDRLSLLQGLMDTDGWVEDTGAIRFSNMNRNVAHSVWHLIVTLGGRVQLSRKKAELNGKNYGMTYELHIVADFPVFSCKRKLNKQFQKTRRGLNNRSVKAITRVESRPVRCITVANEDGMFCAGRDLVPTHNSYMGGVDKLLPEVFITKPIASTLLSEGKKRIFWIVGPNFSDSEKEFRVIWNYIKKLEIPMCKPSYNSPETGDMIITLWDGAMQIVAKSAQNPERLVGEGLSGVILSEAAKLKESIWYKYIRPTLADFQGWSFSSSTPEGKNWFYRLWQDGQDPNNPDWASWRMPAWINNYVYRVPTKESDVMKLVDAKRHSGTSVYKLANDMNITIDPEILASINELTPEAFLQEIAADFCADEETEILTQRGWLRYNEVQAGDQTLGIKMDGTVEWTDIQKVNVFPERHRKMVKMVQRAHDSLTTLDHRWLVEKVDLNGTYGNKCEVLGRQIVTSENLGKSNERVVCARPVTNLPVTQKYSDALVELVAWYWTEGNLREHDRNSIDIAQDLDKNWKNWYSIERALISEFGSKSDRISGGIGWTFHKGHNTFHLRGEMAQAIWQHAPGKMKEVSYQFITELTRAQLKLFIDTSIAGDGWVKNHSQNSWETTKGAEIAQKLHHNLDVLQFACQLYGLRTNLVYRERVNQWWLRIFEKDTFYPVSAKRSGKITQVDYFGKVWCPSTSTSTWLARRNGTVYFTGNTEFVGRVFKEFDEEKHVTDLTFNPGWQTFAAVDYGYHNPNVWLLIQMGPWGEINVLDEIYEEGLDPEDFADEIRWRRLNPGNLRYFFPDPADPGASRILEKKLGIKARGGTGGELNNRINHIRKALREPRYTTDELYIEPDLDVGSIRPRLLFDRRCKRTIEDMLNYRYPEKQAERETSTKRFDNPMKKDDHGPEALGRFFAGMFGQFGKPMTGTTIHSATFRRDETPSRPRDFVGTKDEKYRRPAAHEKRREDFPTINDGFDNYMKGHI